MSSNDDGAEYKAEDYPNDSVMRCVLHCAQWYAHIMYNEQFLAVLTADNVLCENCTGFQSLPGSSRNFVCWFTKQRLATRRSTSPTCWRQCGLLASTHCDFVVRRPRLKVVERAFSVAAPRVCGTNYRLTWSCVAQQHRSGAKSKLPCSHRRTAENNTWATTMWCALGQPVEGAIQDTALTVTVSDCMVHVYNLCAVL